MGRSAWMDADGVWHISDDVPTGGGTLEENSVDSIHLKDSAVITAKIDDLAVTDAKIDSVSADKITGEIDGVIIENGTITGSKLASNSIGPGQINSDLSTIIDGKNTTFYSSTMPTGGSHAVGDTWFDTSDGYRIYVWDGTKWNNSQDTAIGSAANKADSAWTLADGKNKIYYAATAPTGAKSGDTWFDTSNDNKIHIYSGSSWDAIGLGSAALDSSVNDAISSAQDDATDAKTAASTAASNATNALNQLSDILADNKITPDEKQLLKKEWLVIASEKAEMQALSTAYNLPDEWTTYNSKYNTLDAYLNVTWKLFDNLSTTTTIDAGETLRTRFKDYYDARTALLSAVYAKIKVTADDAYTAAGSAQSAATSALTAVDGKSTNYYGPTKPTGGTYKKGDIWFNTSDGNRMWSFDGSDWVDSSDERFDNLPSASGGNTVYYQGSQPSGGIYIKGDIWFDTSKNYKQFVYTGSTWQQVADYYTAQTDATNALTAANSKNKNIYSPNAPSGTGYSNGDMWFQTLTANGQTETKLFVYDNGWKAQLLNDAVFGGIDAAKVVTGYLSADRIKAGSLHGDRISAGTLSASAINAATMTVASGIFDNLKVSTGMIDDLAVTDAKIANVDAAKIVANWIEAGEIKAGSITGTHIAGETITGANILGGTITGNKIAADTVTASNMVAGTITAASGILADASVGTANIINASITDAKIASLDASKITAGTIAAARIGAGTITADKMLIHGPNNLIPWNPQAGYSPHIFGDGTKSNKNQPGSGWGYSMSGGTGTNGTFGNFVQFCPSGPSRNGQSTLFDVVEGESYRLRIRGIPTGDWGPVSANHRTMRASLPITAVSGLTVTGWEANQDSFDLDPGEPFEYIVRFTVPERGDLLAVHLQKSFWSADANVHIFSVELVRMSDASLVVEGAISAEHIQSGSIESEHIQAGVITASHLETDDLMADWIGVIDPMWIEGLNKNNFSEEVAEEIDSIVDKADRDDLSELSGRVTSNKNVLDGITAAVDIEPGTSQAIKIDTATGITIRQIDTAGSKQAVNIRGSGISFISEDEVVASIKDRAMEISRVILQEDEPDEFGKPVPGSITIGNHKISYSGGQTLFSWIGG